MVTLMICNHCMAVRVRQEARPNLFLKILFSVRDKQKKEVYGIPEFANFIEIEGNVVRVHTGSMQRSWFV